MLYVKNCNKADIVEYSNKLIYIILESIRNKELKGDYFKNNFSEYLTENDLNNIEDDDVIKFNVIINKEDNLRLNIKFFSYKDNKELLILNTLTNEITDRIIVGTNTEYIMIDGKIKRRVVNERGVELIGGN